MSACHLSVIICAHNPRPDYLNRTLAALAAQTLSTERWELLLIDNLSSEPLAPRFPLPWHPHARHLEEKKPGLTAARLCGIAAALAPVLLFVDDDNELAPDYLAEALAILESNPRLGCIGSGAIRPEFETAPAAELTPYTGYLALREIADIRWSNQPRDNITPWGAGLVVRREVAQGFAAQMQTSPLRRNLGRSGQSLLSGEDDEFTWIACALGYGKGLFPRLALTHLISSARVDKAYLLRLAEGVSASHAILGHLHGAPIAVQPEPSFGRALSALARGKVSQGLSQANEAIIWRRLTATDRAFASAVRRGHAAAHALIAATPS